MTRQNAVVAGGSVASDSDENAADTGPVRDLFGAAVLTSGSTTVSADNSPAGVARDESGCEPETGVTTEAKTGSNVKPGGKSDTFVEVAVPSPLHRTFDYIWPFAEPAIAGLRVTVPFGRRSVTAFVVSARSTTEVPVDKLKRVTRCLESEPLLDADMVDLLSWAGRYYRYPLGEVFATALPAPLRKGESAALEKSEIYRAEPQGRGDSIATRAPIQKALYEVIKAAGITGVPASELSSVTRGWRRPVNQLINKGLIERFEVEDLPQNKSHESAKQLSDEQQHALATVRNALGGYQAFLLNGVTGSGKTEVYLQLIQEVLAERQQVLVLVPEISLTPQLLQRFRRRLNGCLVCLHSAMSDRERMQNWLLAANGRADVVIGTRSAVFTPLPKLGLIVIDEEHDASLKQQDGFRYHARDLALLRARNCAVPVLMGTATPSLESLRNVEAGRFQELSLTHRAAGASSPTIALLDIRRRRLREGLSDRLIEAMRKHIDEQGQVLVFLNRRGFAPTLICNDCGSPANCTRCDAHMTVHARLSLLRCHHCGAERPLPSACEDCSSENLDRVGCGTERVEAALIELFPDVGVLRIDRDSTRRKGALQQHLQAATDGEAQILVGTQMLAKGHHFPNVTLVGVLDSDRGLYGTDFRSLEQMGQLIVQVAGRAGRETRPGTVLVQTRNPENPLLQTLVFDGYEKFALELMNERRVSGLPPFAHVCLIRAEAVTAEEPRRFLDKIAHTVRMHARTLDVSDIAEEKHESIDWFGPVPAPMERLAGRYRAQLLVIGNRRSVLNHTLGIIIDNFHETADARRVRWSIDVDPLDFY